LGSFHIKTDDGRQLGFVLFAKRDADWASAGFYDCILMGIPHDASLFDDPRGCFILDHRHQEQVAEVNYEGTEMITRITTESGWILQLRGDQTAGHWLAERGEERFSGHGNFLPERRQQPMK